MKKFNSELSFHDNIEKDIPSSNLAIDTAGPLIGDGTYPHATPTPEEVPGGGMTFEDDHLKKHQAMSERKRSMRSLLPVSSFRSPVSPKNGLARKQNSRRSFNDDFDMKENEFNVKKIQPSLEVNTIGPRFGDGSYPDATPSPQETSEGTFFKKNEQPSHRHQTQLSDRKNSMRTLLPISPFRSPVTPKHSFRKTKQSYSFEHLDDTNFLDEEFDKVEDKMSPRVSISLTPPPAVKDTIKKFSHVISPKKVKKPKTPTRKSSKVKVVLQQNVETKSTAVMKRVTEYNGQLKRSRTLKRKTSRRETSGNGALAPNRPKLTSSLFHHNPVKIDNLVVEPLLVEESKRGVCPWEVRGTPPKMNSDMGSNIDSSKEAMPSKPHVERKQAMKWREYAAANAHVFGDKC